MRNQCRHPCSSYYEAGHCEAKLRIFEVATGIVIVNGREGHGHKIHNCDQKQPFLAYPRAFGAPALSLPLIRSTNFEQEARIHCCRAKAPTSPSRTGSAGLRRRPAHQARQQLHLRKAAPRGPAAPPACGRRACLLGGWPLSTLAARTCGGGRTEGSCRGARHATHPSAAPRLTCTTGGLARGAS